jgi:hypothetical protein
MMNAQGLRINDHSIDTETGAIFHMERWSALEASTHIGHAKDGQFIPRKGLIMGPCLRSMCDQDIAILVTTF